MSDSLFIQSKNVMYFLPVNHFAVAWSCEKAILFSHCSGSLIIRFYFATCASALRYMVGGVFILNGVWLSAP